MKKIQKKQLDSLIYLCRRYWHEHDKEVLTARIAQAQAIEKESDISWSAVLDFVDAIVMTKGINFDADNRTIYMAFQLFGWDVVAE